MHLTAKIGEVEKSNLGTDCASRSVFFGALPEGDFVIESHVFDDTEPDLGRITMFSDDPFEVIKLFIREYDRLYRSE